MRTKIKKVLLSVVVGVLVLPTVSMGGSITVSLIEGQTPEESVQILAGQIDVVLSRLEIIEIKQGEIEIKQGELEAKQGELETKQSGLEVQ